VKQGQGPDVSKSLLKSEKGNKTTTTSPFTSSPMPHLPQDAGSPFLRKIRWQMQFRKLFCFLLFCPDEITDLPVVLVRHLVQFPDDLFFDFHGYSPAAC